MNEINHDSERAAGSSDETSGGRPSLTEWLVLGLGVVPAIVCFGWILGDVLSHTTRAALSDTWFEWLLGAISFAAFIVGNLAAGLVVVGVYSLVQAIARRLRPGTTVTEWLEEQEDTEFDVEAYYRQETAGLATVIVRVLVWLVLYAGSGFLVFGLTGPRILPPVIFSVDFETWASYLASAAAFSYGVYASLVIATGGAILTAAIQKRVNVRKSANEAS